MSEPASEDRPSLLVVDDDDVLRDRLVRAFRDRGFHALGAGDHASALRAAAAEGPEYAVVDLRIPGGSGLDVVRELLAHDAQTKVVVLTGYGSIATALEAVRLGAVHYLTKPADVDDILGALTRSGAELQILDSAPIETPSLARAEWEHINRVLVDCGGNISEAARRLGVHRRSLQRKLSKYPPAR